MQGTQILILENIDDVDEIFIRGMSKSKRM